MADLNRAMSGARHTCKQLGMGEVQGYADLCVVVEAMREVTVKRGKTQGRQMAFITLSDSTYSLDGSCAFPDLYDKIKLAGIDVGDVVSVSGKISDRGMIINKMRLL
jgi:DNA polymerase III alpha subunit